MRKYRATDELKPSTTKRGKHRAMGQVNSIIVHTTGYGVGLKRLHKKFKTLEAIDEAYANRMARILKYKGHFLIGYTGTIYQFLPLNEEAWHTGSGKRNALRKFSKRPAKWWRERWAGKVDGPMKHVCWQPDNNGRISVNARTIGIDLLAHGPVLPGYTDSQYKSLDKLTRALCVDLKLPFDRLRVLGHEDVHPIDRNGWDPGKKFVWERLFPTTSPDLNQCGG